MDNREQIKEAIRPIVKEIILQEDQLSDIKKNVYDVVQKYTPSAVLEEIGYALRDAYDDKKITASYVKKSIAALTSVQKKLNKAIS